MRILQIIPHYLPAARFGGPQVVAHCLGRRLITMGHSVTVCTTNLKDERATLDVDVDVPYDVQGIKVFYEPTRLSRYWGYSPMLARRVRKEVVVSDAVLVHAHYQYANWVGARAARRMGKPYILFPHGSLHMSNLRHRKGVAKQLYLSAFEKRNLSGASYIAFNGEEEKRRSLYHGRGVVIPSGIQTSDFENLPPLGAFRQRFPQLKSKTVFLFLGRIDIRHKGLDLLLEACAGLEGDYHLVIAGPDERGDTVRLRRLVERYSLGASVTLVGILHGEDKLAALQDSDAFVLPSRFEGLSIALLEALYMGLPALVSAEASLSEEVQEAGAGVKVKPQADTVREGLITLMSADFRRSAGESAKVLVATKYTCLTGARLVESLLENALQGTREK